MFGSVEDFEGVPSKWMEEIKRCYSEPQRRYHTWSHVERLLWLLGEHTVKVKDVTAVRLAILFHEYISCLILPLAPAEA